MLLISRIFQGLGNAMVFATGMAILVSVYPPNERGRVIGINAAFVYIGLSSGPFLGGLLTQYLTWRSVFLFTIPVNILILFLIFSRLKGEWMDARGEKFDLTGSLIYAVSVVSLVFGISLLPEIKGIWVTIIGVIGFIFFAKWELRTHFPIFEIRLFMTNRVFTFSCLAAMINYAATYALTFLMSIYLQHIGALSPQVTGMILIVQPIIMVIISPYAGKLSDRVEPSIIATAGMTISAIGLFLLIFLGMQTSFVYIISCLLILGVGFGAFTSPNTNAILSAVDKRFLGTASGTAQTMRTLGMTLSMGIATILFSVFIGRVKITPALYPQLLKAVSTAFGLFTGLCLIGIFASMVRGNLRHGQIVLK